MYKHFVPLRFGLTISRSEIGKVATYYLSDQCFNVWLGHTNTEQKRKLKRIVRLYINSYEFIFDITFAFHFDRRDQALTADGYNYL